MDDALGLMVFSISASVAQALLGGEITVQSMVLTPVIEIVGSLALGGVLGLILGYCSRFFASRGNKLSLSIALVLAGVGLCDIWNLSSLLVCMMIGAVMVNVSQQHEVLMEQCDRFTPPLFLLFFVLSGAELDLNVLPSVGLIGVLYLLLRALGKWGGSMLGAVCVRADKHVQKYLGLTLLPQAGVAIGMTQLVSIRFPSLEQPDQYHRAGRGARVRIDRPHRDQNRPDESGRNRPRGEITGDRRRRENRAGEIEYTDQESACSTAGKKVFAGGEAS